MNQDPAISGTDPTSSRAFGIVVAAASARIAIAQGGYFVVCDVDTYIAVGDVTITAAAPTVGAQGAVNGQYYAKAGDPTPINIPTTGLYVAVKRKGAVDGTAEIYGPLRLGQ